MSPLDSFTRADPVLHGPGRPHNVPVHLPGTPRRWAALAVPVVSVLILGLTIAADAAAPASGPGVELAGGYGWPYAAIGVVFGLCSGAVLLLDRRQAFGWVLGGLALFWGIDGLAPAYVRYGVRADEALAGVNAALWVLNRLGALLPATVAALLLIFPTGRFLEGRWGRVGRVSLTLMVCAGLVVILAPSQGRVVEVTLPPGVDLDAGS